MSTSFARSLDELAGWRAGLVRQLGEFARFLGEQELLDAAGDHAVLEVRQRLAGDKLLVAFVAEFSRGKSELINAIFFADTGRRVLPATPGRTTMCTVELAYDAQQPPQLSLLPIATRLEGLSLGELRQRPEAWTHVPLDPASPQQLADALSAVTRAEFVSIDQARALGFWNDEQPQDNPPVDAQGRAEIPAWRHALINYPHPLLQRGLIVLDTPGLNAVGAEPELTLGLLPTAHATVFVLAADAGVTKSDLSIWQEHLASPTLARFVVLNKIDTLRDPLLPAAEVELQIEQQCETTAATLDVARERVFALSARDALAARVAGDAVALQRSRLPALEAALDGQLLPQRRHMLQRVVLDGVQALQSQATRRLSDRKRQVAEQMLELRGLRGKSSGKSRLMLQRVELESREFEACTARLVALRSVHAKLLRELLQQLSSDRLRDEVAQMQQEVHASLFNLRAKRAFLALCERLRTELQGASRHNDEIQQMLAAAFTQLNTEYGFALNLPPAPTLERAQRELELIERNYVKYLGLSQALKLAEPKFMEQFRRMLLSKLRVVFENAAGEVELWSKSASQQIDLQLRERRRGFKRRSEALQRIQGAAGELEQRIAELELQERHDQQLLARVIELAEALRERALQPPGAPAEAQAPALRSA